ncbi:MAG: NAD(P)/FAD-dependent oxidoreductase, partial [Vicinamibacterales bacterium]
MRTRYGLSPWVLQYPDSRRPRFDPLPKGDGTADVVVVGAGLTGLLTAYFCAKAGYSTLVLEADRVGQAGSGRSGGVLTSEPDQPFKEVSARLGLKAARRAFESWSEAAADGAALLKRLKVPCGPVPADTIALPWRADERPLQKEHQAKTEAGLDGAWLSGVAVQRALKLEGAGARKTKGALLIDPYAAAVGVLRAAVAAKAKVYERTKVSKVTFDRKVARVLAGRSTITTENVVIATNFATAETKQLQRHVGVRQRFHVLTEPLPAAMRKGMFGENVLLVDARSPRRRLRWTADGRLLISGGDQKAATGSALETARVHNANELMYETLLMYPGILGLKPEFAWESSYGYTIDGLPCIGPHRFFPHHLLALAGSGDSLTEAFLAA